MVFALIETGGKQYRVAEGNLIAVEKLSGVAGDKVALDKILMVGGDKNIIGKPYVSGYHIEAEIIEQTRDAKIMVFKKKRRKNYRRTRGHRQYKTLLRIGAIKAA